MNGDVHLSFPPIKFYPPQKLFDSPPYTDPWLADNTPTPCLGHVCKSQMVRLRDLWKEVTPSVPIEQGVVARSGGKVVKTVKSSPFSFDRGNAANLIPLPFEICPLVHCTELGGDVFYNKNSLTWFFFFLFIIFIFIIIILHYYYTKVYRTLLRVQYFQFSRWIPKFIKFQTNVSSWSLTAIVNA